MTYDRLLQLGGIDREIDPIPQYISKDELQKEITGITGKIPAEASEENQLADKAWVLAQGGTAPQNYVTVATYAELPAEGSEDTIYRVSSYDGSRSQVDETVYSEYAWYDSDYLFLNVKSQIEEVYDISAAHSGATYTDLAAALGVDGANVPAGIRRGGMSIKFVQSTDHKYVQYRLMAYEFSTTVTDWQGVDDLPIGSSDNLVKSMGAIKYSPYLSIYNGTLGNASNRSTIHTSYTYIDSPDAIFRLCISAPELPEGYSFKIGYFYTDLLSRVGQNGGIKQEDIGHFIDYQSRRLSLDTDINIKADCEAKGKNYKNVVGIAFNIAIQDSNGNDTQVSVSDFEGYGIKLRSYVDNFEEAHLDEVSNLIDAKIEKSKLLKLYQGTIGGSSTTAVCTEYVRTNGARYIAVHTDKPLAEGYTYYYGFILTDDETAVGKRSSYSYNYVALDNVCTHTDIIDISDYPTGIAIGIVMLEKNNTTSVDKQLLVSDFDGYNVTVEGSNNIETLIKAVYNELNATNVYDRNQDKIPMLLNSCRYHRTYNFKDYQVLIITDTHGWELANKNAVEATNKFASIDALVHAGDICGSYYRQTQVDAFIANYNELTKAGYIVIGNHDVGTSANIAMSCTHTEAYNAYIKPMVDKGFLSSGEYTAGKPYWYHDNTTRKIRLIGIYEYDDPMDINETYWRKIPYSSDYPNVATNTSYSAGDKVNGGVIHDTTNNIDITTGLAYTDYSFECVDTFTTPDTRWDNTGKFPAYKILRGRVVIRQEQAQWFLDTLSSTPAGYGVVVITHNPYSVSVARTKDCKFSWPANKTGGTWTTSLMITEFISKALIAFKNKQSLNVKVVFGGAASYLNTLNDGTTDYAYEVSKDFTNSNGSLFGLIGGHSHRDLVWEDSTNKIYQISPNCGAVDYENDAESDIRRTREDGIAADSITVASFAENRIGLVKLGVNVTDRGTYRDYEVITWE